jgi:hypothetical protein
MRVLAVWRSEYCRCSAIHLCKPDPKASAPQNYSEVASASDVIRRLVQEYLKKSGEQAEE